MVDGRHSQELTPESAQETQTPQLLPEEPLPENHIQVDVSNA
jgi:hypothetical protein